MSPQSASSSGSTVTVAHLILRPAGAQPTTSQRFDFSPLCVFISYVSSNCLPEWKHRHSGTQLKQWHWQWHTSSLDQLALLNPLPYSLTHSPTISFTHFLIPDPGPEPLSSNFHDRLLVTVIHRDSQKMWQPIRCHL